MSRIKWQRPSSVNKFLLPGRPGSKLRADENFVEYELTNKFNFKFIQNVACRVPCNYAHMLFMMAAASHPGGYDDIPS